MLGSAAFVRFWAADAISNLGTFVSALAVQLLLINELHADQTAVGVVRAAQWLPYLLFGLLAGVVVDRVRRKPVLVAADLVCAGALGAVGVLGLTGRATVPLVAVLVFVAGSTSMFFTAAHQSYLPTLVPTRALPQANARLGQTYSATQAAGPLVAGSLVRVLSAPVAILVDALSYLVSAATLASIRTPEATPGVHADRHVGREIRAGARWLYRHETLAGYAIALHLTFFFSSSVTTVLVYFATIDLGIDAFLMGVVLAAAGIGGVIGAGLAPALARRIGLGRAHVVGTWLGAVGWAPLLVAQAGPFAAGWLSVANLLVGLGGGISSPLHLSYRNAVTPDRLRGRMNATIRAFNWGSIAIAAPLSGWFAAAAGNRVAIAAGMAGLMLAAGLLTASAFRSVQLPTDDAPDAPDP